MPYKLIAAFAAAMGLAALAVATALLLRPVGGPAPVPMAESEEGLMAPDPRLASLLAGRG